MVATLIILIAVSILSSIGTFISYFFYTSWFAAFALVTASAVLAACLLLISVYIWVLVNESYLK